MNHLSTLECQDCGGESGIVPNIVAVSYQHCQFGLEMLDRLLVHEQAENAPAEALDRLDVGGPLLEPAWSGNPYTTLFPEFQPPPTQTRSRSISTPRRMRLSDNSDRLQAVNCLMATTLNAVGMTQLAEPGSQGHP
jgi:hypothetical protein